MQRESESFSGAVQISLARQALAVIHVTAHQARAQCYTLVNDDGVERSINGRPPRTLSSAPS